MGLPRVIDAHVHIFPDKIFSAVRNWFDAYAWKIRYRDSSADLLSFLLNQGVDRIVALQYAHKPGIARSLNQYMSEVCHGFDEILPYRTLVEKYDNLWLDTAMVLTDYFPRGNRVELETYRMDRIMYGSDFPNIPYAWDRELLWLENSSLSRSDLEQVLYRNAEVFFDLAP